MSAVIVLCHKNNAPIIKQAPTQKKEEKKSISRMLSQEVMWQSRDSNLNIHAPTSCRLRVLIFLYFGWIVTVRVKTFALR